MRFRGSTVAALSTALMLAALSVAGCGPKDDPGAQVLLRYHYKVGDKYLAVMEADQDIVQKLGGQTNKMDQTMTFEMGMEVVSVDESGTSDIKVTYRRVAFKQSSRAAGKVDYDSADPGKAKDPNPALVGFKALVGKSLMMTMDDRGNVKGVSGTKELVEGMLAELPAGQAREMARQQLANMLDEKKFSQEMDGFSVNWPESPVKVGDTWQEVQTRDMGFGETVLQTTYKVRRITVETVELDAEGTLESGKEPDPSLPIAVTLRSGEQAGTVVLDRVNPIVAETRLKQKMDMTVTVRGQSIEQSLIADNRVTTTLDTAP
ncbi:MAG TPA: DUF6263 family protein [Planctomycetota bacterium]|nr:DUF6263 family protein [Planctomycetota bacterium]